MHDARISQRGRTNADLTAFLAFAALLTLAQPAAAQEPVALIETFAGGGVPRPPVPVVAYASGVAVDTAGTVYIADRRYSRVIKIDDHGNASAVAGTGRHRFSGDGSPAISAQLTSPSSIAVSSAGDVYIWAFYSHVVHRVAATTGIITTVAGNGTPGSSGDGGQARYAQLDDLGGIAVDSSSNLYLADPSGHRVRKVEKATGIITTVAGTGHPGFGGDGGAATAALLNRPEDVAVDDSDNLYIADSYNFRIRKVDAPTGQISTVAATTGLANRIALDSAGDFYVADFANNRLRKVDGTTGGISTVAGTGAPVSGGDGGPASSASTSPNDVAVDLFGNIYIAEHSYGRVRKVDETTGKISTIAAGPGTYFGFSGDGGPATSAQLARPAGVAVDAGGNVFIAEYLNMRVRKVDAATGNIATVAGTGLRRHTGDGGPAVSAGLRYPADVSVDQTGNVYVVGRHFGYVRRIEAGSGIISTVAGTGSVDGVRAESVAAGGSGNIYIAGRIDDVEAGSRILKVEVATGTISTIAGTGERGFSGDGGAAVLARLGSTVWGVAVDDMDNVYFSDSENDRIRKVDAATGIISTVAGTGEWGRPGGYGDGGLAVSARLSVPGGVAVDRLRNVYIADRGHSRIRKVDAATGIISTIAGTERPRGYSEDLGDGGPAKAAKLDFPEDVAVDSFGNVYIADEFDHRIRRVWVPGASTSIPRGRPVTRRLAGDSLRLPLASILAAGDFPVAQWRASSLQPSLVAVTSHLLTVARPENGRVAGAGIDCGSGTRADCEERPAAGATVRLTATADPNHLFAGWGGACSGTAPTCSVVADAAKTVEATFSPEQRLLLVSLARGGSIAGPGIDCGYGAGGDCAERYDHGAEVELAATAAADQEFVAWSGCESETPTCTLTMDGNRTAGASFRAVQRTLTATPPTDGYLTAKGLDCGAEERTDCEETMPQGSQVVVYAMPAEGYAFASWSGDACSGTAPKCTLTLDQDRTVGAAFGVAQWTLTVNRPSSGYVTGTGISCGSGGRSDCTEDYDHGTAVSLTATADRNHDLGSWSAACSGTAVTCSVVMDGSKTVDASFAVAKRTLTVTRPSHGYVTGEGISCGTGARADCTEDYDHGTTVTLTATADQRYDVGSWSGCSSTGNSCRVTLDGPKSVTAAFISNLELTVEIKNRSLVGANGYVKGAGINCGSVTGTEVCKASHRRTGSVLILKAVADPYYTFSWSGCDGVNGVNCFVIRANRKKPKVEVAFDPVQRMLTVSPVPANGYVIGDGGILCGSRGRTICVGNYSYGTTEVLTAIGDPNYVLQSWGRDCSDATTATCNVTLNTNKNVSATFQSTNCAASSVSWSVGSFSCSGTVPASVDGETRGVRDDAPDHVGKAKYTCRAGAWQKDATGTACYEYPKCGASATTEANACRVGSYSAAPADTYQDGKCSRRDGACAGGTATPVTTDRVDGKCGAALEQCATGTFEQVADTKTKHRWRCRGANGRKAWSCQGTSGRWKWSCTNVDHTRRDCSLAKTGDSVACTGSVDRGTSPLCQKSPSCGTLEVAKLVGDTLTCSCVADATRADGACGCDAGYEVVGNSCQIACPTGCSRASCASSNGSNARTVCRCAGSSCPAGYVQSGSCSTTAARTCTGDTDGCGRSVYDTRCRTTFHSFADAPREFCRYEHRDRNLFSCRHQTRVCQARVTHVGCVQSSDTTPGPGDPGPGDPGPGDPGPGGFSDDEWSAPAKGYLLPTFECGATANTCTVAFEDETLVSDDYGVVDKADTAENHLWECHSDNGTVRQCALPKGPQGD